MTQIQIELSELLEMVEDARTLIIEQEALRAQSRIELDSKGGLLPGTSELYHVNLNQISDKLHNAFRQNDLIHILSLQESHPGWPASVETSKGGNSPTSTDVLEGEVVTVFGGGGKTGWPP